MQEEFTFRLLIIARV